MTDHIGRPHVERLDVGLREVPNPEPTTLKEATNR